MKPYLLIATGIACLLLMMGAKPSPTYLRVDRADIVDSLYVIGDPTNTNILGGAGTIVSNWISFNGKTSVRIDGIVTRTNPLTFLPRYLKVVINGQTNFIPLVSQ